MVGRRQAGMYYCALCPDTFTLRTDYNQHIEAHDEQQELQLLCQVCALHFSDSHALEVHATQTGHRPSEFACDKCGEAFPTQTKLKQHVKFPSPCYADASQRRHRAPVQPISAPGPSFSICGNDRNSVVPSPTPTDVSGVYCHDCKKSFASEALYSRHCLSCKVQFGAELSRHRTTSQVDDTQSPSTRDRVFLSTSAVHSAPTRFRSTLEPEGMALTPLPCNASPNFFNCDVRGCGKSFRSEAGLKVHKQDNHGIGGQGLDLHGRDSWMLSQEMRNQLRISGSIRSSNSPSQNSRRPPANPGVFVPPMRQTRRNRNPAPAPTSSRFHNSPPAIPMPVPTHNSANTCSAAGSADVEQANQLYDHVMPMLITADIAIHPNGVILYDGVPWFRIGVARQDEAVSMCDKLVHLRKSLQMKFHLSHATTFAKDFEDATYPGSEPEHLPGPQDNAPRLKVVAFCCNRILLADGREEVVKIAAVDVLTARPLMSYLVCTDPTQAVKDWRSQSTGISGFPDFERFRSQKFKVLKGWKAARAALSHFADKNTILVGYNLRSDLDALRIVHGRSIDLVKLVEKAADGGAFSKRQLRLDTLLRDLAGELPEIRLRTNSNSEHDCLLNAFAVRELTLRRIKDEEQFVRYAKKKSLEYQRILS